MIDCKELSVGDWVYCAEFDKQVIDRVECVEKNRVYLEHAKLYTPINYIKPIPLTEEILKKNGFEKKRYNSFVLENRYLLVVNVIGGHFRSFYYSEESVFNIDGIMKISLWYVHQLQHFLRHCGIEKEIEL